MPRLLVNPLVLLLCLPLVVVVALVGLHKQLLPLALVERRQLLPLALVELHSQLLPLALAELHSQLLPLALVELHSQLLPLALVERQQLLSLALVGRRQPMRQQDQPIPAPLHPRLPSDPQRRIRQLRDPWVLQRQPLLHNHQRPVAAVGFPLRLQHQDPLQEDFPLLDLPLQQVPHQRRVL